MSGDNNKNKDKDSSSGSKHDHIDFDDPLFVHPSDNSITTIITIKLTGNENYRLWRSSMLRSLKARNKLGFIDGTLKNPTDDPNISLKWERANAVVCSWILGSISESIYGSHAYSENAEDI